MPGDNARAWATAWVGPLVFATHLLGIEAGLVGVWSDDSVYLDMATSMAAGEGPRLASLPLAPLSAKYPPLWPWLMSLLVRGGLDPGTESGVWVLHAVAAAGWATAAQGVVTGLVPRLGGGRLAQLLVGALLVVNTTTIKTVPNGMSEGLFTALFTGALLGGLYAMEAPRAGRVLLCAGLAVASALTRSVAAPLMLVGAVGAGVGRQWRLAGALAAGWAAQALVLRLFRWGVQPLAPDAERVLHYYVSYSEHVAYYAEPAKAGRWSEAWSRLTSTVIGNTSLAVDSLGSIVYPARILGIEGEQDGSGTLLVGVAFLGAAVAAMRAPAARPLAAVIGAYFAVFVAWTWPFSSRFWLPVVPVLVACAVVGVLGAGRIGRLLAVPLVALVVIANGFSPYYRMKTLLSGESTPVAEGAHIAALRGLAQPDDVLLGPLHIAAVARKVGCKSLELEALLPSDLRLGLMLGQRSWSAEAGTLSEALASSFDALGRVLPVGANAYVVVDPTLQSVGQRRVEPLIRALVAQRRLTPALASDDAWVWRVAPAP